MLQIIGMAIRQSPLVLRLTLSRFNLGLQHDRFGVHAHWLVTLEFIMQIPYRFCLPFHDSCIFFSFALNSFPVKHLQVSIPRAIVHYTYYKCNCILVISQYLNKIQNTIDLTSIISNYHVVNHDWTIDRQRPHWTAWSNHYRDFSVVMCP